MPSNSLSSSSSYAADASKTQKLEMECRHLSEQHDNLLQEVNEMEVMMGITR